MKKHSLKIRFSRAGGVHFGTTLGWHFELTFVERSC